MPKTVTVSRDATKPASTAIDVKAASKTNVDAYHFVRFDENGAVEDTTGAAIDAANEWDKYFTLDTDGTTIKLKDEYRVFTAAPAPGTNYGAQLNGATDKTAAITADFEVVKTNAFYSSATTNQATNVVTDEDAFQIGGTYFDTNGKYKGGLFAWDAAAAGGAKAVEIGFDRIDDFVDVKKDQIYAVDASGAQAVLSDSNVSAYYNTDGTLKEGVKLFSVAADTSGQFGAQLANSSVDVTANAANYVVAGKEGLFDKTTGKLVSENELKKYFDGKTYKGGLAKHDTNGDLQEVGHEQIGTYIQTNTVTDSKDVKKALTLSLHVGADSTDDNQISVDIKALDAKSLGLKTGNNGKMDTLLVNGSDDTNARKAIDTIAEALQQVSTQRSALGAVQNRLEHTIANLDNVVENTTAAESQIRDTDMATEMVKFSNNNILAQAGQAMLAQANQANQGVLSLLG